MAANMQKRSRQERFGASACKAGSASSAPMSGGKLEVQRAFPPMSRLVHERTHRNIHFLLEKKQAVCSRPSGVLVHESRSFLFLQARCNEMERVGV